MASVNLDDAKAHLGEIISGLSPGEQLVIVQNGEPVATLIRTSPQQWSCKAGSARHTKHWMAPDFDAPLDDFREYSQ
jgi:prevent-host-death family protein